MVGPIPQTASKIDKNIPADRGCQSRKPRQDPDGNRRF